MVISNPTEPSNDWKIFSLLNINKLQSNTKIRISQSHHLYLSTHPHPSASIQSSSHTKHNIRTCCGPNTDPSPKKPLNYPFCVRVGFGFRNFSKRAREGSVMYHKLFELLIFGGEKVEETQWEKER